MSIVPGKQVAALEPLTTLVTTDSIDTGSAVSSDREVQSIVSITGKNTQRLFLRNIRLSRSASQYNSGQYGDYDGSDGYQIRIELWSWVSDSYDYTSATADDDGPSLLAWRHVDTTGYDASTQSLILDFPLAQWFGPTFPDVSGSPFKFAIVVIDDSGSAISNSTSKYDLTLQYDKARAV
jgi:hypothetical protein